MGQEQVAGRIEDGGPAWPNPWPPRPGMSLRDWFAGQAMAGMVGDPKSRGTSRSFARDAYAYADAMLAARKEVPQ